MTPRIFPLLAALRGGGTIYDMAALLKVHPRTIKRDIIELRRAGFRLVHDKRKQNLRVWYVKRLNQTLAKLISPSQFKKP